MFILTDAEDVKDYDNVILCLLQRGDYLTGNRPNSL